MSERAIPRPGAAEGLAEFEIYDAHTRIRLPYGEDDRGFIDFYPDAGFLHVKPEEFGYAYATYNFRQRHGSTEGGTTQSAVLAKVEEAKPILSANGIDVEAIPKGYPELDELFTALAADEGRIEPEDFGQEQHTGQWFIVRTTEEPPTGTINSYDLFKLSHVTREGGSSVMRVHSEVIGPLMQHFNPEAKGFAIKEDHAGHESFKMRFDTAWSGKLGKYFNPSPDQGSGDTTTDLAYFTVNEATAKQILNFEQPSLEGQYDHRLRKPYGREAVALGGSLDALQFARWSKWEEYDTKRFKGVADSREEYIADMTYESYERAIANLVERFGEDFFREIAWERMVDHLKGLDSRELTENTPYKAHADIMPIQIGGIMSAATLTANAHPLPARPKGADRGYGVDVFPLYADADFWKVMKNHYPETFTDLSERWLSLQDGFVRTEGPVPAINTKAIIHPRALLRDHFPEAYNFLVLNNPRFTAPLGSIAVRNAGRRR